MVPGGAAAGLVALVPPPEGVVRSHHPWAAILPTPWPLLAHAGG